MRVQGSARYLRDRVLSARSCRRGAPNSAGWYMREAAIPFGDGGPKAFASSIFVRILPPNDENPAKGRVVIESCGALPAIADGQCGIRSCLCRYVREGECHDREL